MKKELIKKIFIVALMAFLSIIGIRNSDSAVLGGGFYSVILIGTVISSNEKGDTHTFDLLFEGNKCRFKVTQAFNRSSSSISGWRLLKEIIPRRINVIGDEKIFQPLLQADIVGKELELKGRLYLRSKKFHLSSIEEVLEEETSEEDVTHESK